MTIAGRVSGFDADVDAATALVEAGAQLPFNRHMGLEVRSVAPGRCTVALPADERLENHIGTPHAVAQLAPAELAGAMAAGTRLIDLVAAGWIPVIAGLDVRYHAPAPAELVAVAEVSDEEATTAREASHEGERVRIPVRIRVTGVRDDAPVATMTAYYVFLPPEQT